MQRRHERPAKVSQDWQKVGAACVYLYEGPHGFALQPGRFKAEVLGFTTH